MTFCTGSDRSFRSVQVIPKRTLGVLDELGQRPGRVVGLEARYPEAACYLTRLVDRLGDVGVDLADVVQLRVSLFLQGTLQRLRQEGDAGQLLSQAVVQVLPDPLALQRADLHDVLLHPARFGYIVGEDGELRYDAAVVGHRVNDRIVPLVAEALLEPRHVAGAEDRIHLEHPPLRVLHPAEIVHRPADDPVLGQSEPALDLMVRVDDRAVRRYQHDRLARGVDQGARHLLALAELYLGAPPLVDLFPELEIALVQLVRPLR